MIFLAQEEQAIATKGKSFTRVNEDIRVPQVRLIGADGEQIGVVDTAQAIQIAEEAELDLVEIAPDAHPPVCRVVDYGKFRYDREKKAKEARKKQHNVQMKGIRINGANISEHDLEYRLSHMREFIETGNRVKVSVRFRGRQMAHKDVGEQVIMEVVKHLSDVAKIEAPCRQEGRRMVLMLAKK